MLDILIKNGTVIDGSGRPGFQADVAVEKGIITRVEPHITDGAGQVIDAQGLTVTPGFINTHSHSDDNALETADCCLYLEQGITTQLVGNCGSSLTPCRPEEAARQLPDGLTEEQAAILKRACQDPAAFMAHAQGVCYGVNAAYMVGHTRLRSYAMGPGDGRPTESQLDDMKNMIDRAMKGGMYGYSSGLVYAPSVYADTWELTELAKAAAAGGGIYASHIRGEGIHVFDSIAEAIRIGEDSGAPVLISHIKIMGKQNRGRAAEVLELIHRANERGVKVFADQYPYEAASAPLLSQIPPKYLTGGREKTLQLIADKAVRRQIEHSIFHQAEEFESCLFDAGYKGSVIVGAQKTPQFIGMTLAEVGRAEGKEPIDAMMDVLIANQGSVQGVYYVQDMQDILTFLADPYVFTGDDWSTDGVGNRPDPEKKGGSHPRGTSTFVRKIELARDKGLLTPEGCIYRMTGGPAQAVGIANRGLLRPSYAADICLLDYDKVRAQSDYLYPYRRNLGIRTVIVNGRIAVQNGLCTGDLHGRTLLHR